MTIDENLKFKCMEQSSSTKQVGFTHGHRSLYWELCTKEMCFLGVLTWQQVNQHLHNIVTLVLGSYRILMYTEIESCGGEKKNLDLWEQAALPPEPQFVHQFVTILIPLHERVVLCVKPTSTPGPRRGQLV